MLHGENKPVVRRGYLMLKGKRFWCVVGGGEFAVFTQKAEDKENMVMQLRVDTASCDIHCVQTLHTRTEAVANQHQAESSVSTSIRTEHTNGSHVTTIAKGGRSQITLLDPLVLRVAGPTATQRSSIPFISYMSAQTAPKQLQSGTTRFAFTSTENIESVDDTARTSKNLSSQPPGITQSSSFPSFTIKTKVYDSTDRYVEHTFQCVTTHNAEAAEWVDAVVRARGNAIRSKQRLRMTPKVEKHNTGLVDSSNVITMAASTDQRCAQNVHREERNELKQQLCHGPVVSTDTSALAICSKNCNSKRSSQKLQLDLRTWADIDALTIPIDYSKSNGVRQALQIDRQSQDYQDI
jgi:hypothetical protein